MAAFTSLRAWEASARQDPAGAANPAPGPSAKGGGEGKDSPSDAAASDSSENKADGASTPARARAPKADTIANLTIFVLAIFIGFEVITKVPPTLHTPLMSGSNAISGITVVGSIAIAGAASWGVGPVLGFVAASLAMINVVGGFLVTHRMLMMFRKK
ncbi:MAG: hypothetical protein FJ297_07630 [Planctomycetes bacterium]|nr:hypothetical protein [Planctomycetota bacterium]